LKINELFNHISIVTQLQSFADEACLLEVLAPKAGNVHPGAAFEAGDFEDFALSALVTAPILAKSAEQGVGASVLAAVRASAERDAEERRWVGAEGERALYEDPHLLLRSLQDVDAACDVVAVLPGSPPSDFPAVPSGREFHLADLLEPCRTRCAFLEEVAKYRLQILD